MSLLRRNFVPDQGRKTGLNEIWEAFSDEEMGQKPVLSEVEGTKQKGIPYFLSVPKNRVRKVSNSGGHSTISFT